MPQNRRPQVKAATAHRKRGYAARVEAADEQRHAAEIGLEIERRTRDAQVDARVRAQVTAIIRADRLRTAVIGGLVGALVGAVVVFVAYCGAYVLGRFL